MEKTDEVRSGGAFRNVELTCKLAPGRNVAVAGSFNDWEPKLNPMTDEKGDGEPHSHLLKFTAEGHFIIDFAHFRLPSALISLRKRWATTAWAENGYFFRYSLKYLTARGRSPTFL